MRLTFTNVKPCVRIFMYLVITNINYELKIENIIMRNSKNNTKMRRASITAIGILFITLGITINSDTNWLFILGGVLILMQVYYDKIKQNKK